MYKEAQLTHFNQKLEDYRVPAMWDELKTSSQLESRIKDVEQFNMGNQYKKRGIAMIPTK
jgi:xanthine dehydrogenase/oxidase